MNIYKLKKIIPNSEDWIESKDEFFELFKGYLTIWQIQMLYFIQDQDDEEKQEVLNLIKFVDSWFDENSNIPNWYINHTKK